MDCARRPTNGTLSETRKGRVGFALAHGNRKGTKQRGVEDIARRATQAAGAAWRKQRFLFQVRRTDESARSYACSVSVEAQNQFTLVGRVATVGGKPDIIAVSGDSVTVCDAKTGREPSLGRRYFTARRL